MADHIDVDLLLSLDADAVADAGMKASTEAGTKAAGVVVGIEEEMKAAGE